MAESDEGGYPPGYACPVGLSVLHGDCFSLDLSLSYLAVKANQIARKYQLQTTAQYFLHIRHAAARGRRLGYHAPKTRA